MFVQVIAEVTDRGAVREAMDRWTRDLPPAPPGGSARRRA